VRAALALTLIAIALAGCGGDGGGSGKASGAEGKPGTEETRGGTKLVAFPAGDNIADVLVGPGGVWVAYTGEEYVSRIDPAANEIARAGTTSGEARALASDGKSVWVLAETLDEKSQRYVDVFTKIEPAGGKPIRTGLFAKDAEFANGALWASIEKPQGVQGFEAESGEPRGPLVRTKGEPWHLAAGDGVVWAVDNDAGVVLRIDATTGAPLGDPIRVGESPFAIALAAGAAWIPLDGELARIDARSGALKRIPMSWMYVLDEIVSTGDALWIAEGGRPAKLHQIDPRTGREVGRPRSLGTAGVNAIDAGHGSIWIALNDGAPATPDEVVRVEP
jgi:streptogramin lyase